MEVKDQQVRLLIKRIKRLELGLFFSLVGWLGLVVVFLMPSSIWRSQAQQTTAPMTMRVSELIVTDKQGRERVRIGGDLPDPIIGGKKVPRGQQAAGILLYDSTGNERSGYLTFEPSGNVGLTLDSRKSQVATFIAAADADASMFQLWSGKDLIELRSDGEGSRLTATKNGQVILQEPVITTMSANMCNAYKEGLTRVEPDQVMSDCRRRFTEVACKSCLGKK